jgi:hypothetical protein
MKLGVTKTQIAEEESCLGRERGTIGEILVPWPGGKKHEGQRRKDKKHGTLRIWKTHNHIQSEDPPREKEHLKL